LIDIWRIWAIWAICIDQNHIFQVEIWQNFAPPKKTLDLTSFEVSILKAPNKNFQGALEIRNVRRKIMLYKVRVNTKGKLDQVFLCAIEWAI